MSSRYVGAKNIGQKVMDFVVKIIPRKKKVSPDIKDVKPTKDIKGSVKRTKSDEYVKRITTLDKAEGKIKSGKQMIKEGQKERKTMVDTKRAFQFKHTKGFHAIKPGDKPEVKYKGNVREQKMGGGMMGRRFGYKGGKLVGKQSIIAKQAGDPKKIESVDFKVLQAKRKNKKKVV